jgi:hypothetical protein
LSCTSIVKREINFLYQKKKKRKKKDIIFILNIHSIRYFNSKTQTQWICIWVEFYILALIFNYFLIDKNRVLKYQILYVQAILVPEKIYLCYTLILQTDAFFSFHRKYKQTRELSSTFRMSNSVRSSKSYWRLDCEGDPYSIESTY